MFFGHIARRATIQAAVVPFKKAGTYCTVGAANYLHSTHRSPYSTSTTFASFEALNSHLRARYDTLQRAAGHPLGDPAKLLACNFTLDTLPHVAKLAPEKVAIRYVNSQNREAKELSYRSLYQQAMKIGSHFARTLKKNSPIALMLGQHPAFCSALLGLRAFGFPVVPLSTTLSPEDITYRFNELSIQGIITRPDQLAKLEPITKKLVGDNALVCGAPEFHPRWRSLDEILPSASTSLPPNMTTNKDRCLFHFTSGTTGRSKAATHNQDYPYVHLRTGTDWMDITTSDIVFNASDTGWGFFQWTFDGMLPAGATQILWDKVGTQYKPVEMLTLLQDEGVTVFAAAPTVLRSLASDLAFKDMRFPSLRRIVTVGEPIDPTVYNAWQAKGIALCNGYGQAETPLLSYQRKMLKPTMGEVVSPYRIVLLDKQSNEVQDGEVGEVCIDTHGATLGVFRGYYNNPERTNSAFFGKKDRERYYRTGDLARKTKDGVFKFISRDPDMLKSGDRRIGPYEVEYPAMSHPALAKVVAVDVPVAPGSSQTHIKLYALVKPDYEKNARLTPELLKASIQKHIGNIAPTYAIPAEIKLLTGMEWDSTIPVTPSGKVRRKALRDEHSEGDIFSRGIRAAAG